MRRKEINFDYDSLNRLTKITNALAGITQHGYNGVDRIKGGNALFSWLPLIPCRVAGDWFGGIFRVGA